MEILLAVVNGAKLLVVPDSFRSIPSKLADAIMKYAVTFIQASIYIPLFFYIKFNS